MKKLILPSVFALAGLIILISLGTWQLQRHVWKKGLLQQVSEGIKAEAIDYASWKDRISSNDIQEFIKVRFSGILKHEDTVYSYSIRQGRMGLQVFTPVILSDGGSILVNRGFILKEQRKPGNFSDLKDVKNIEGFIRRPETKSFFTPEPSLQKRVWFSIDPKSMRKVINVSGLEDSHYIELFASGVQKKWPIVRNPEDYVKSIPNKHFEYALTWYGLAFALICVFIAFSWSTIRRS
ncbi:MAG: SURF1 family protein [Methyloligellaceae bacterium]